MAQRVAHARRSIEVHDKGIGIPREVILDSGLPGMSGYDVGRELRRDAAFAGLELIALSGWGSHEDKKERSKRASVSI